MNSEVPASPPNAIPARRGASMILRLLIAAFLLCIGFGYGFVAHRNHLFPYSLFKKAFQSQITEAPKGNWAQVWTASSGDGEDNLDQLRALGYAAGTQIATGDSGVVFHDKSQAFEGLSYYTSGHAPEAILMGMDGEEVHAWSKSFEEVWPDREIDPLSTSYFFYSGGRLLENGEFLAIFDHLGLIKLDRESELVWASDLAAHHAIDIAPDGRIYVLTARHRNEFTAGNGEQFLDDYVTILTPEGKEVDSISVLDAFQNSNYAVALKGICSYKDPFHANAVKLLDGSHAERSPIFKKGNVLISLRSLSIIAILDPEQRSIVWAMAGMWKEQHDPHLLDNGNIALFDNKGHYGYSKVIEFDPLAQKFEGTMLKLAGNLLTEFDPRAQKVAWSYEGSAINGFYTKAVGAIQRLPNGNTLITQSESGRAIEVNPDKQIVWEFLNPARAGNNAELVAMIPRVSRLLPDYSLDWLKD